MPRAPRWNASTAVIVTVHEPGRENFVLHGVAVNASLEGTRLRLARALPEGRMVSVALEGAPPRLGSVRWVLARGQSEILHGVRFELPLERRGKHARPLRRLRRIQHMRRGFIVLIGLAAIALAAYGVDWWMDRLRTYYPKFYEPKDIERQRYEQQSGADMPKKPSDR